MKFYFDCDNDYNIQSKVTNYKYEKKYTCVSKYKNKSHSMQQNLYLTKTHVKYIEGTDRYI